MRRMAVKGCAVAAAMASCLVLGGCEGQTPRTSWGDFGGDADKGKVVITQASCGACHMIPGVVNATGLVGPPLSHFQRRTTIAGFLPNTPTNLIRWVRAPQSILPGNAMPDTPMTDQQARDAAAYLYSLK